MKILIIEDTPKHQESARKQFRDENLELAQHYQEGLTAILASKEQLYDAVLTDLLMPKGGFETMGPDGMKYVFDLLPYGFPLVLLAAKYGAKYVGLVTDVNHHDHPLSAAIDPISSAYWREEDAAESLYKVNKSTVGIFHAPFLQDGSKDWKKVLEVLTK